MIDKMFLVAQREWMENVRTKAFWIGLLIVPVVFIAALILPSLLSKTKAARDFAVLDRSGWVDEAVRARAFAADLEDLLALTVLAPEQRDALGPGLAELISATAEAGVPRRAVAARIAGLDLSLIHI